MHQLLYGLGFGALAIGAGLIAWNFMQAASAPPPANMPPPNTSAPAAASGSSEIGELASMASLFM